MQVSTVDTVTGAGSGKEAAKPTQAASDAFAVLLQNALTQNSSNTNLRTSNTSELAGMFAAPSETPEESQVASGTEYEDETSDTEDASNDEPFAEQGNGTTPNDRAGNDVAAANVQDGSLSTLTGATEAQISQSRARGGNTATQQQTSPDSQPAGGSINQTSKTSSAAQSPSDSRPGNTSASNNTGQASAQVTETAQQVVSRPASTLTASAAVAAQSGANTKSTEAAVAVQTGANTKPAETAATATTSQTAQGAKASGDPVDKPATSNNAAGQDLLKDSGTSTARNTESSGNLLLNNSSASKTASQYSIQPGRAAASTGATPTADAANASAAANTNNVPQAPAAAAQNVGQSTLSSEAARQAATSARAASAAPVSDTASPQAGTGATGTPSTAATTAAKAAAPARPTPAPPNLNEQISVQIKKAVSQGTDRIRIQLKPAELGRLDIQLEVSQDGRVAAIVNADRPETLDMLRRDARGLQQALQDAGLQMDSNNLSFNLGNGNAPSEEQLADGRNAATGDEQTTNAAGNVEDSEDATPRRQSTNSMIDVEV